MALLKPTISQEDGMTNLTPVTQDTSGMQDSVMAFAKALSSLMDNIKTDTATIQTPEVVSGDPTPAEPIVQDRPQYYTDADAAAAGVTTSTGRVRTVTDTSLPTEAKAFLDTIARYESPAYDVIVGQGKYGAPAKFTDFSRHPNIIGMRTVDGPSTAAGRYQFVNKTWRYLQQQYPGQFMDFSPLTQDRAAWRYAQDVYKQRTGRDLLTTLRAGNIQDVKQRLANIWIGFGLDRDVVGTYTQALRNY